MGNTFFFQWEIDLMHLLQNAPAGFITVFSNIFGIVGDLFFVVAVIAFMYWCYDKKAAKFMIINFLPALVIAPMIKNVLLRRRPYFDNDTIKCFRKVEPNADMYDIQAQGFSCPSMHSANALTIFGSLAVYFKKKWLTIVSTIVILCVGISRVVNGVHFPTDVLIGWALGALSLLIMSKVQKKTQNTLIYAAALAIIGIPGWFFCKSTDFYSCYGVSIGLLLGIAYEEKKVNFKSTRNVLKCVLRIAGGALAFLIISEGIKLILPASMSIDGTFTGNLTRTIRYIAGCFVCFGIYPKVFDKIKLGKQKQNTKAE